MTLGDKIKQLRESKKYSQEKLADLLNVHSVTISKWENGTQEPRAKKLNELAKIFGVSNEYLLSDSSNAQDDKNFQFSLEGKNPEKPFQSMAYWGSVVDNARRVASLGNYEDMFDVSELLKRAQTSLNLAMAAAGATA